MGHVPDVPSDFRRVPGLCYLHRWHTWYLLRVPCQQRRCTCRADNLCGWLWAWSVQFIRFSSSSSDPELYVGPMVWAPLSEVPQIGRMPVYIFTLAMFVVLQVPTALATNYGMLMAFRFLTGFFGSPILATGGATIADIYAPKKRAYGMTLWGVFATCAPSLGPLVGGFAAHAEGWRWTIWEIMWLSGPTLVLLFFFFPETSASNILYRRAKRLRKVTGNPSIKSASEIAVAAMRPREVAMDILVRPFALNFQEPIVLVLNIYIGLIYALLYIWFESFPIVFIGIYHWREQMLGLSFLGIFVGTLILIPPFFAYLYFVQEPKYNDKGELKPEERMPIAIFGAFIVPICLFWFGWTSRASVHWIVPIIGSGLFGIAALLLFVSAIFLPSIPYHWLTPYDRTRF
jgi:DHA1 family multidrug resistance protein-like MFS transporter